MVVFGLMGPFATMSWLLSVRSNHLLSIHLLVAGVPNGNSCRQAATNWGDLLPVPGRIFITYTSC